MTKKILSFTPLLLATFVALRAENGFPDFNWDRVPLYAHLGINDGLTPEQVRFLADRFKLVAFTGGVTKNSVEPNIAAAARAIKQRNPKAKVLFYWASDMPKQQWKLSNASFPEGGYLKVRKGNKEDALQFDVRRADVRDWWSDIAAKAVHEYACDGIFVDGATAGDPSGPWVRMFGQDQAAAMDQGVFAMLQEARRKMGSGRLILFNPLHGRNEKGVALGERYLPVADGAMMDDFDRGANVRQQAKEYLASEIEGLRQAARDGKIVVFKAWPGFTWWSDKELMKKPHEEQYRVARGQITFPLACFLIGAGPNSYFCYTWGWLGEYGTFDWYPEFDRPLGPPKGEGQRVGWTYTREFEHAAVFVDLAKKTAKIDWK
jgi:hypothetical protein